MLLFNRLSRSADQNRLVKQWAMLANEVIERFLKRLEYFVCMHTLDSIH